MQTDVEMGDEETGEDAPTASGTAPAEPKQSRRVTSPGMQQDPQVSTDRSGGGWLEGFFSGGGRKKRRKTKSKHSYKIKTRKR